MMVAYQIIYMVLEKIFIDVKLFRHAMVEIIPIVLCSSPSQNTNMMTLGI